MSSLRAAVCCCVSNLPDQLKGGRVDDDEFYTSPKFIGNSILLYGKRNTMFPKQVLIGPDWYCMAITYLLMIIPTFFFLMNVGNAVGVWVIIVGFFSFLALIITYSITACSDPGIVFEPFVFKQSGEIDQLEEGDGSFQSSVKSISQRRLNDNTDYSSNDIPEVPPPAPHAMIDCNMCKIKRPKTASHCYECGVCVDRLDHHCPWTGKCIGPKNIWYFHAFLTTLCVHLTFVIVICLWAAFSGYTIFYMPI